MNLQTMDYFIVLAHELSFTHAAQRLSVTQQTLSAHISNLEKELGVSLFKRTSPLKLTYPGEVFLGYAKRIHNEKQYLDQEFKDMSGEVAGRIRLGIATTRGYIIMPSVLQEFRTVYPQVSVEMHEGQNFEVLESLKTGDLDMVVAHIPGVEPSLQMYELYHDEIVLCVSQNLLEQHYGEGALEALDKLKQTHSLAWVEKCPFLLVNKRDVSGEIAREFIERSDIRPRVAVVSRNAQTLLSLAEKGVGISFSPAELVQKVYPDRTQYKLHIVRLGDFARYSVHAAWKKSRKVWSAQKALLSILNRHQQDTAIDRTFV